MLFREKFRSPSLCMDGSDREGGNVKSPKVMVIGLDSADYGLVRQWCDSGDLPVLRALRDRGVAGVLTTPPGLGDDAVWASFYTGVGPGRHGRYHYRQLRPGSYRVDDFSEVQGAPFWDALSRAGRRVAILDVPKCPLVPELNGLQVTDWLVHGRDFATGSSPPEVARDLLRRLGDDETDREPEYLCRMEPLPDSRRQIFVERLLKSCEKKTSAVLEILNRSAWDLLLVVFKEAHCVAHQLWQPDDVVDNPVKRVYQALDTAVGRVLAGVDEETNVIVFSDLGMTGNITGEHLLEEILFRLDPSVAANVWRTLQHGSWGSRDGWGERTRTLLKRKLQPYRSSFQVEHNEISGAVRVNLKGREPHGRIAPGPEFEAFLGRLTEDLLAVVNPDSGQPLVAKILRTDQIFTGEACASLPDLFVVWNRTGPITAAASPKIGEVRIPAPQWRPGNHASDGFFFASGPAILERNYSESASIMDLAPTIGRLLDVSLPDLDGRCISAICRS
jgi:predicted AlkP superfamily phosphohydrolase/phosphomutase